MTAPRRLFIGLWLLALGACSSGAAAPAAQNGDNQFDLSDVTYVGAATDEALLHLLDAPARDDPRQYVTLDAPSLDAPLSADAPPTFVLHAASQAFRAPGGGRAPAASEVPGFRLPLRELLEFLSPVRVAYAHGIPYNGTAYLLTFTDSAGKRRLRVFTSQTSFTLELAAWQSLAQAPGPLKLSITSAFFEENQIPDDGGPFVGADVSFRIQ